MTLNGSDTLWVLFLYPSAMRETETLGLVFSLVLPSYAQREKRFCFDLPMRKKDMLICELRSFKDFSRFQGYYAWYLSQYSDLHTVFRFAKVRRQLTRFDIFLISFCVTLLILSSIY